MNRSSYSACTVVNASIGAAVVDSFGNASNNRQGVALRRHMPRTCRSQGLAQQEVFHYLQR